MTFAAHGRGDKAEQRESGMPGRKMRRTRPLRRFGTVILAMSVTSAMLPLAPAHSVEPDGLAEFAAEGLAAFARSTEALGQLSPMSDTIPGTATSAAQLVGFDAGFMPAALLEPLGAVEQVADLAGGDSAPLGELTIGDEYDATISATAELADPAPLTVDRQLDITLEVEATRTIDVPLGYVDPEEPEADDPDAEGEPLDLTGGTVPVEANATGTFEFVATEVDNGDDTTTYAFWMQGEPTFTVTVDGDDDDLDFDGRYGFTEIDVTGSAAYEGIEVEAEFVDPNGDGTLDLAEMENTLGDDLFAVAFTDGAVDLALDFDSDLVEGETDGTLTAAGDDLVTNAYPTMAFDAGEDLAQFATVNADDALLGVGQAGVAMRAMLGTADTRLPFLDGFVADLYDPGKALFDFAEARANAVIVCGSADTQPPSGRLVEGGVAYCQAVAGNDAQTVTWEADSTPVSPAGLVPTNATSTATVGTAPTENVRYDAITLPLDISVEFTEIAPEDDAGEPDEEDPAAPEEPVEPAEYTVVPRFATAQEMERQLDDAGFAVTTVYDDGQLRYDVQHSTESTTIDVPFDVGDLLRPGANLTKVTPTSGDPVPVTMTDGGLDTGFGIRMGELDDVRFVQIGPANDDEYVAVPAGQVGSVPEKTAPAFNTRADLLAAGVDIVENPFILEQRFTVEDPRITIGGIGVPAAYEADFDARIGMLPVKAETSNFTVTSDEPAALSVSLPETLTGPVAITELMTEHLEEVASTVGLGASMTLGVTAEEVEAAGGGAVDGTLTIEWADVATEPLPSVTPDDDYATDLQPFDIRATVSGFVTGLPDDSDEDGDSDDAGDGEDAGDGDGDDGDDGDPPAPTPASTILRDDTADFLTAFGIAEGGLEVAAPLFNTSDGTMCGAFTVVDVHTLECDEPLAGGTDLEELAQGAELPVWEFEPGDAYEIPGDPEALRKVVLESLVQVSTLLENPTNPVFTDTLPFLDLRPSDAVNQFTVVREALGELIVEIDAHGEARDADGAVVDGEVVPAEVPPWDTVGGLISTIEARLQAACDADATCAGPVTVAMALDHRPHPAGGSGDIAYLDLVIDGLGAAGTKKAPLRLRLDDYTLTQAGELEVTDGETEEAAELDSAEGPFQFDANYTSQAQMGIGIPLAKGVPATDTLVLDETGVTDLTIDVDTEEVDLEGAIGSVGLFVGKAAALRGSHVDLTVTVDTANVVVDDIVRNLTNPSTCVVAEVGEGFVTCAEPMADGDGAPVPWTAGDRFVVHAPTPSYSGSHTGEADAAVLSTDDSDLAEDSEIVGDLLVNETAGTACVVAEYEPFVAGEDPDPEVDGDETEDQPATVTCEDGANVTWAEVDAFSVHAVHADEAYVPTDNGTRVYDPAADFVELGVETGMLLEKVDAEGEPVAACAVTEVAPDADPTRLVCDGLSEGETWQNGDAYRLQGIGILRMSLFGSLELADGPVPVAALLDNLVGTLAGVDHAACDGDDSTSDACAKLSLELMSVPEPEEGEAPAQSYIGIVTPTVDVARTHTGGPADEGEADGMAALSTGVTVLSEQQVESLGISPLDWSLLPATTPYLAFLMGDALDGSATGKRLPLIGAELDNGADIEQKLLDLSGALGDVGYDLDDAIEDEYTGGPIDAFIEGKVVEAFETAAGDNALLDGVTPVVDVVCGDCDTPASVDDIRVTFTVGEEGGEGSTGFETGLPGVQLYADEDEVSGEPGGNIETTYDWSMDIAFGIDRLYGPYIAGGDGEEFQLSGTAAIGDGGSSCPATDPPNPSTLEDYEDGFAGPRCIDGRFGLLKGTMFDAAGEDTASDLEIRSTTVSLPRVEPDDEKLTFADLIDGVETVPTVDARGTINLLLRSAPPNDPDFPMALPRLLSVFTIDYDSDEENNNTLGEYDWWHPDYVPRRTNGWTSPGWYDAVMDLGPFVESILGPVLDEVSAVAKPVKPVIDVVTAPIPVITDLHQAVGKGPLTMLDVLEQVSGNDLTLLRRVLATIQLAGSLPQGGGGALYVRLDEATDWGGGFNSQPNIAYSPNFTVDVEDVEEEPCEIPKGKQSCKKTEHDWKNGQGKSTYDSVKKSDNGKVTRHASGSVSASGAGITFPFLDDVRQVYGLFVGVDATLVRVDAGTLSATAGMTYSFGPFMAGPVPVEVQLGGAITLNGRFAMGYDTRGFRRLVANEEPITDSYLLDGLFIDDLDASGKDVNEIELIVQVSAGASASLKIVKVGLEAVVTVTIGLNFNDPDKNGKLYLEEVMMWLENPICLFDVKGTLEFVLSLFFEINLFVKKLKFTQVLFKLKPPLVLFEFSCSPPPPVWATKVGNDLVLNVGDRASNRGQFASITSEKFTVRQVGATKPNGETPVEVTAFGIPLPYDIPSGGKLLANTGAGNDTVRLLPGQDEDGNEHRFERASRITSAATAGGTPTAGKNRFEGGDGNDELVGGTGADVLRGGAGNDVIEGGGGNDALDGGTGSDLLYGGADDDRLIGGPGRDLLHGGGGHDNLDGGPGLRGPAPRDRQGNERTDLLDPGNLLVGGAGDDTLNGGPVTDYLFGDDVAPGPVDAEFRTFGANHGTDRAFLNSLFATPRPAMTTYCANAGTQGDTGGANTLAGHDGEDFLFGGDGPDIAEGGRSDDLLCTGAGDDIVHGGKGSDELWAGSGDDRLDGGVGNDRLHGGAGRDLLDDRDGSNVLVGGEGPDQLLGAPTANLLVGDDLGVRNGSVRAFVVGDPWPAHNADLTAAGASITIHEPATAAGGTVTVCATGVVVIGGGLDLNGDHKVDADDDGWFEGYEVVDGSIDVDGTGSVDGDDNGMVAGYAIAAGLVDLLGTGTPVTEADDPLGTRIDGAAFAGDGNADCLIGGLGNDRLHGVDGADHLDGGDGDDHLEGNRGNDFVRAGLGNDTAWGGNGDDVIHGDSGDDKLYGGAGGDAVHGGPGTDYIEGNQGNDELFGGDGDDTMLGGSSSRTHPTTLSAIGTLATPAGDDVIYGDEGDDLAFGDNVHINASTGALGFGAPGSLHGNDRLFGGPGDDVLMGQLGVDVAEGNDGNDYAFGDIASLALPNGRWADPPAWHALAFPTAAAGAGPTHWPGGAPRYTVTLQFADLGGDDDVYGNVGDDHVWAGHGDDYVEGGFGDDYLEGNGGADEVYGLAADVATAEESAAAIFSTPSDQDVILGGSSAAHPAMTMAGGAPDTGDFLRGNLGADVILGDNGTVDRQVADSGWASDDITGGHARTVTLDDRSRADQAPVSGNDIILGDEDNDRLYGTGGDDHLQGNDGDDYAEGNQGSDWLEGNDGDDDLIGGSSCADGAVTCTGDPDGADLLFGGRGQDVATGDNAVIKRTTFANPYLTTAGRLLGFGQDRWVNLLNGAAAGEDRLSGGADDDVLLGQGMADWVSGGPGDDYLEGNAGSDGMFGDRLLSEVGGVTKVQERFEVGAEEEANVLAVPASLVALDVDLLEYGLDRRLGTDGLFDVAALGELEGVVDDPATGEGQMDGQDDMVGGSRTAATADGNDLMWGDGEADAMTGDNADVTKAVEGTEYKRRTAWYAAGTTTLPGDYGQRNLAIERSVMLHNDGASGAGLTAATEANAWGDDYMDGGDGEDVMQGQDGHDEMWGGNGNDVMTGRVGNDRMFGGDGDDAMLGARGEIVRTYINSGDSRFPTTRLTYKPPPFLEYQLFVPGRLHHEVTVTMGDTRATSSTQAFDGTDLMRGGRGRDDLHGGAGDDRMNGDSGGDALFGGDGGDAMWGGKGNPDGTADRGGATDNFVDYLYGGHGGDKMDFQPQAKWATGTQKLKELLVAWTAATEPYDHPDGAVQETSPQSHQGIDWIYGGYDADVLQANVSQTGPNDGDRLMDWTGAYNLYTACPSDYGGHNHIRSMSPGMIDFLEQLAHTKGAGSLANIRNATSAAYRNLGIVYTKDNKNNSGKAYADDLGKTPGHVFEGLTCVDS